VVSSAQWLAIVLIGLPALGVVLWPLVRGGSGGALAAQAPDRRLQITEEKATVYRSLKELALDHQAGHLSDDHYHERPRPNAPAGPHRPPRFQPRAPAPPPPLARPGPPATAAPWTRRPATLVVGSLAVLALGIGLGVGITRYTAPAETMVPPGSRLPV